jgi:hypothetical protein
MWVLPNNMQLPQQQASLLADFTLLWLFMPHL